MLDQMEKQVMATYVRTIVQTMRNLGIDLAPPYAAPTAVRTRMHQYLQYRFYNPLSDTIEVVPTTRAGINRWIRRQRALRSASTLSNKTTPQEERDCDLRLWFWPIKEDFKDEKEYEQWRDGEQGAFLVSWATHRNQPYPLSEMISRSSLKRKHRRDDKVRISQPNWDLCQVLLRRFPLSEADAQCFVNMESFENISILGSRLPIAFELFNVTVDSHVASADLSAKWRR